MYFNSIEFTIFLPLVFLLYWYVAKHNVKFQNIFLLVASYIFYGWWDWRFLGLILFSSLVDYTLGLRLASTNGLEKRKMLLFISLGVNLGVLFFFKYFNFFITSFSEVFTFMGVPMDGKSLGLILPVGISFYTFQTLSYTIDVYRKKVEPTVNIVAFLTFVSFFPQLVAGPIERASHLLPQFYKSRFFNRNEATNGLKQILWGFFKKIVIADNAAQVANHIFNHSDQYNGSTLWLGAVFFAFQIYGDFSGYSDIAIGVARLFGINLKENFSFPYFSRNIGEFWRRWHISLSSWFRDYLYIPLGGSRVDGWKLYRNIFLIFVISGLWHGAKWTFVFWGFLHACYFLPLLIRKQNRKYSDVVANGKLWPSIPEFFSIFFTFILTTIGWVFFRADSLSHAFNYLGEMFSPSLFDIPSFNMKMLALQSMLLIAFFITVEWFGRHQKYAIEKMMIQKSRTLRFFFYYLLIFLIFWFSGNKQAFIYFQF